MKRENWIPHTPAKNWKRVAARAQSQPRRALCEISDVSDIPREPTSPRRTRRFVLRAIAALSLLALYPALRSHAQALGGVRKAPANPARARPRRGDRLTPLEGAGRGKALRFDDLSVGAAPLLVVPLEPETGLVRDGSRLNHLRLLRLSEGTLSEETARYAAAGVVAYSGVCSHTGCPVSEWNAARGHLVCPCHGSEFDPAARASVMGGPAPRRLAILPLREEGGELVVRSGFRGKVGFDLG